MISYLRYAVTAVLAGLVAAESYYPHALWIPVVAGVIGTLGIHVVPAAGQGKAGG